MKALALLLASSSILKLIYVLRYTSYHTYLTSDFGGYWERALARGAGSDTVYSQWALWPPMPHILLSWWLRAAQWADPAHPHRWLLSVLAVNVALSAVATAAVWGIARRLTGSRRQALVAATLYAFCFPLWYFNAFVMSEHAAVAALLAGVWLVTRGRGGLLLAGLLVGAAIALRPAFALLAVPCLFALRWRRAPAFAVGVAAVLIGAVAEVHRISAGRVMGLGANGGVNFYFAQCGTHKLTTKFEGYTFWVQPPSTASHPENGHFTTSHPFHEQAFYWRLGWECAAAQPAPVRRAMGKLDEIYFGDLFPGFRSARGGRLIDPSRWIALLLTLAIPLGLALRRRERNAWLLASLVAISFATQLAFNAEHRYLYSVYGFITPLAVWSMGLLEKRHFVLIALWLVSVALLRPREIEPRREGCIAVAQPGKFEFAVASQASAALHVGAGTAVRRTAPAYYDASRGAVYLDRGRYAFTLTGALGPRWTAVWRRADEPWMPAVGLRKLGDSADGVRFLPAGECAAR